MRFKLTCSAMLLAAGLLMGNAASANMLEEGDVVTVGDNGDGIFGPGGYAAEVNFMLLNQSEVHRAYAGTFILDYQRTGDYEWNQFVSFCLEPDVYLTPFSNPYTVNTVEGAGYNEALMSELWGRYFWQISNETTAAAFQVALWEIAFGQSDMNVMSGDFRLTSGTDSGIRNTAQSWLQSLNGSGPLADDIVVLVNNPQLADRQDLITRVPEPTTLGLLGLGLAAIGAMRRRRHA